MIAFIVIEISYSGKFNLKKHLIMEEMKINYIQVCTFVKTHILTFFYLLVNVSDPVILIFMKTNRIILSKNITFEDFIALVKQLQESAKC